VKLLLKEGEVGGIDVIISEVFLLWSLFHLTVLGLDAGLDQLVLIFIVQEDRVSFFLDLSFALGATGSLGDSRASGLLGSHRTAAGSSSLSRDTELTLNLAESNLRF
jgi:hypothetical protein